MSTVDVWEQVAEGAIATGLAIASLAVLHTRSELVTLEGGAVCCAGCGYPRAGLPPGAVCPECGRRSGRIPTVRRTRFDARGMTGCAAFVLLLWGLHLATPYVWAMHYRADGRGWMTASHRACVYLCTPGYWQILFFATLILTAVSRATAQIPARSRAWICAVTGFLFTLLWWTVISGKWAAGDVYWHELDHYGW